MKTTTEPTSAQQLAARYHDDGTTWMVDGVDLFDAAAALGARRENVRVVDPATEQVWLAGSIRFSDGSVIAEVTEGGWDVLGDVVTDTEAGEAVVLGA